MAATSQLEERVRTIMDSRRARRPLRRRIILAVGLLAGVTSASLAMLQAGSPPVEFALPIAIAQVEKSSEAAKADEARQARDAKPDSSKIKCELAGNVLDKSGRTVAGAEIQVWRHDGVEKIDLVASRPVRPKTDASGRFEIADLPPGEIAVTATFDHRAGDRPYQVRSERKPVVLIPGERGYCRFRLLETVMPEETEQYLSSGGASDVGTWKAWTFDPQSMQAAGHRPSKRQGPLVWGEIKHGLQSRLVLEQGSQPNRRKATLVLRNSLTDRMLSLKRQQDRERFAFEVLHPDGRMEVIEHDAWPFNSLRPEFTWNGLFLRPGDEYDIPLGEFEHDTLTKPQDGASVRGRLTLFSDNEAADGVRREEHFPTSLIETAWVSLGQAPDKGMANTRGADQPLIRLMVQDASSGKPIAALSAIPGVESMLGNDGEPNALAQWQPHLLLQGQAGRVDWPLNSRSYDTMRLRVDADGYRPALTQLIRKKDGPITLLIKMTPSKGVSGVVVRPDGQPAAKAQAAVAMPARTVRIEKRRVVVPDKLPERPADRWRLPLVVETDDQGRFTLPDEVSPALVIVAHDHGYAEIRRDELGATPKIVLAPWNRIEGQVLWGDAPGANEAISLIVSHPSYDWIPLVSHYAQATSDADGRFVFDDIPGGLAQLSRVVKGEPRADGGQITIHSGPTMHVHLASNTPTRVVVGGKGQPLIGKLQGRDDWTGVKLRLFPRAPRPGDGDLFAAYSKFANSPAGKLYHHNDVTINADGTFRIERVLAENYQWTIFGPNGGLLASGSIVVPPTATGTSNQPVDLGVVPAAKDRETIPM